MIDAAKITAILALVAFSLGCAYDYGYFHEIGYSYFNLLTYNDHVGAVVFFGPPTLLLSVTGPVLRQGKPKTYVDAIGVGIVIFSLILWLMPPLADFGPKVIRILWDVTAVVTVLGLCYLTSIIIDIPTFWSLETHNLAILFGASFGLLVFSMWGGILSYHNAMSELVFNSQVVFAKDAGIEGPATAFILRFVDNGIFLVQEKDPTKLAYVRKEAVNLVSRNSQRDK